MDAQLPLIDEHDDATAPQAWHLADDVRRRGLRGITEARQALEAARRRRLAAGEPSAPAGRRAA